MTESSLCVDSKLSSELGSTSDDEFVSSTSTASAEYDEHFATVGDSQKSQAALPLRTSSIKQTAPTSPDKGNSSSNCAHGGKSSPGMAKRSLHMLDLPMEILKEIIKEVSD